MTIWETLRARDAAKLKSLIGSKSVDVNETGSVSAVAARASPNNPIICTTFQH